MSPSDFPGGSDGEESVCNAGDPGSIPGLRKSPGEGNGNTQAWRIPARQRSLAGYSPWGHKESDTTERPTHYKMMWYPAAPKISPGSCRKQRYGGLCLPRFPVLPGGPHVPFLPPRHPPAYSAGPSPAQNLWWALP